MERVGVCPVCKQERVLIKHHIVPMSAKIVTWYFWSKIDQPRNLARICQGCNLLLQVRLSKSKFGELHRKWIGFIELAKRNDVEKETFAETMFVRLLRKYSREMKVLGTNIENGIYRKDQRIG